MTMPLNQTQTSELLFAKNFLNETNIQLKEGERYRLVPRIEQDDPLVDWFIKTDFNGFDAESQPFPIKEFLKSQENKKRMKRAKWFALIGLVDEDEKWEFVIGQSCEITAKVSGALMCYLNDVPQAYFNNQGSFYLDVTRLA